MASRHGIESKLNAHVLRRNGGLALMAVAVCCALAYWLEWHSGCLMDAKTGLGGDGISAGRFNDAALSAAAVAYLSMTAAIALLSRPTWVVLLGSLLFLAMTFVPLALLMLAMASAAGSAACLQ